MNFTKFYGFVLFCRKKVFFLDGLSFASHRPDQHFANGTAFETFASWSSWGWGDLSYLCAYAHMYVYTHIYIHIYVNMCVSSTKNSEIRHQQGGGCKLQGMVLMQYLGIWRKWCHRQLGVFSSGKGDTNLYISTYLYIWAAILSSNHPLSLRENGLATGERSHLCQQRGHLRRFLNTNPLRETERNRERERGGRWTEEWGVPPAGRPACGAPPAVAIPGLLPSQTKRFLPGPLRRPQREDDGCWQQSAPFWKLRKCCLRMTPYLSDQSS